MRWLLLSTAALGLVGVYVSWVYRRRQAQVEQARIHALILAAGVKAQRFAGQDEALRQRTATRRKVADSLRTRAAHVESGASVSSVL